MAKNAQSNRGAKRKLCFVVGPIGHEGSAERKHSDLLLNAVIKDVLQAEEFQFHVKRADEDADPGMIGDRVVSDIINAELVVADLTDLNPNAFYELGIRHSTEKPTIHIARAGTVLPFDNVAHRTIFVDLMDWHSIESAKTRLAESARAISEPGYKVSNPITQANASFMMRQSHDPRDFVISEMQERLASLENRASRPSLPKARRDRENEREKIELMFNLGDIARKMRRDGSSEHAILDALMQHKSTSFYSVSDLKLAPELLSVRIDGDVLSYNPFIEGDT